MKSVVLCCYSGDLPTPHFSLLDFFTAPLWEPRWTQWYRIWEDRLFLGMTTCLSGLTRPTDRCTLAKMPPPHLSHKPREVFSKTLPFVQLLGDTNTRYFLRPVHVGFIGQCVLWAATWGLARVSACWRPSAALRDLLFLCNGENNRTLGLENLCMSSVTLVCFGKEFSAKRSRFLPR